jgi:hypothetical protein
MSRYTVNCHRCGKPTFVDLEKTISDQRCHVCRGFLHGVDVKIGDRRAAKHRKLVIKLAGGAGREPVWQDQDKAIVPIRKRWPRYFRFVIWGGIAGFCAAIIWISIYRWRQSLNQERSPTFVQEKPVALDVRLTDRWRKEATELAKRALAVQTAGELLPMLYHPEVDAEVIRRYYATEESLPLGTDLVEEYYIPPGASKENVVAFNFTDASGRPRAFVVVEKKDGMKIDWPSLVGLGEMSLKDYLRKVPKGVVVMRARARIGDYYNDYFNDGKRWLSVRLCDVTDDNVIHAYFDRELPGAQEVVQALPDPQDRVPRPDSPVIVVLKHPPGNLASDQTQMIALLALTWYREDGLKPLAEQARKLDEVRTATGSDRGESLPGGAPDPDTEPPPPAADASVLPPP